MRHCLFCLLAIAFVLGHAEAFAQTTIKGKVIDAETKEPLIGASVTFETEATGAATDIDGNFTIRTNDSGNKTILVSYIGFVALKKDIQLNQDVLDLGLISLQSDATSLETITVRGSLEGQQRALNQQRTADNIKNVISADLIGRFPDLNVAEAMQRVPGVNIQRDKGEGSTVSLRGTPPHFTTIQINGEQMPSVSQGGSRNEALDLIPADQLSSMEITKAPTPDIDGDAIGGVINLKTPTARGERLRLRAESALGYNDISGGLNGIGKLRLDRRFFADDKNPDGKLGVMLGGSYYSNNNSEYRTDASWNGIPVPINDLNRSELVMSNYQYRNTKNQRERIGATATIDYRFNDNHELIFNYMYNRREDNDVRNRLRFDMNRSGAVFESLDSIRQARVRRDINIWDELKTNHSFNLQGIHTLNKWKIEWAGYYTASKREFTSDRGDFSRDGIDIIADNAGGIYTDVPRFREAAGEQSIYDPFLYDDFRRYEEDYETTDAKNIVGKVDITHFFDFLNEYSAYLKFGAKYRTQTNAKYRHNQVFGFNDPNHLINTSEAFLRVLSKREPKSFLYTDYRFGPEIGRSAFKNYINENRRLLTTSDDAWDAERLSLNDTYDASEDVLAAYIMGRVQIDRLMMLAGVRYEKNDVNYDAFEVYRIGTSVDGTPIQGGNDYEFILPNLHLKYSINRFTAVRFSALYNYARPNFVDIVPFVNFDSDAITLTLGNPELEPAKAFNIDLMVERYFANIGVISIGAFYKDIDKFQFSRIDPSLQEDFPGYPSTQGFKFRQEQNGENATVAGIEVNFVKALDFLPSFLQYFNVDANYTYAYSSAFTQDRENISMPGQAAHTFNAALSYDYGAFSARLSGNYNGTFVHSLASHAQDDIYQLERLHLDANASLQVNKQWRIFGEFVNITNAPSIRYQGERERISRMAYYGWGTRIGVSFRL